MIRRRRLLQGWLAFLVGSCDAGAQSPGTLPRIGFLSIGAPPGSPTNPIGGDLHASFIEGLRDLGYAEGQNLVLEWRYAEWKAERLPALVADLVHLHVDAIVVAGPAGIRAARDATRQLPVVMVASSSDPVGEGLVKSLARPGGNVTGLSAAVSGELFAKMLELLKDAVGRLTRIVMLWDFEAAVLRQTYEGPLRQASRSLGFTLDLVHVRTPADIDQALAPTRRQGVEAVAVAMGGITFAQRSRVAQFAYAHRMPTIGLFRSLPEVGGLMSYGPDLRDVYRRAAGYVDRILKGVRPADLPVEQPTKFELVINVRTAKALGLTIPPAVLARADEVIK